MLDDVHDHSQEKDDADGVQRLRGRSDGRRGDRGDREPRAAATGADGPVPAAGERCISLNHVGKRLAAPRESGFPGPGSLGSR